MEALLECNFKDLKLFRRGKVRDVYECDGELYYEGLCVENNSFYPLDEEQPNLGVTEIHYFNDGKWEQL